MSESGAFTPGQLTEGQLRLIARKFGASAQRSFVDVGCGDGKWLRTLRSSGAQVFGMDEKQNGTVAEEGFLTVGSPAANAPWSAQSIDCILFRDTRALTAAPFDPEQMIALANLGSSLKPRGSLLIPVADTSGSEAARWQSQLATFPGEIRVRTIQTGLLEKLTLAFLFRGLHRVTVVEFRTSKKPTSRLEWHRLAREAVMQRQSNPAAA